MDYEINRGADQPSLTEMVEFAIKTLAQNPKGYFLLVEGNLIITINSFIEKQKPTQLISS